MERDAANEAINQVRTEEDEFKQWTISKRSAYPTSSGNRLFSRSAAEELTPIRDQSRGQSSSSGRKGLGSDIPMSPRSGATLHRGAADKHAHLTPPRCGRQAWIAHQRTQIEAGTFDSRTLTTTISERSWAMIELKDWREDWDMHRGSLRLGQQGSLPGCTIHLAYHHARPA